METRTYLVNYYNEDGKQIVYVKAMWMQVRDNKLNFFNFDKAIGDTLIRSFDIGEQQIYCDDLTGR